ncbi:MAG: hypothetical protein J6T86_08725 [Bacteroidales bacterium]|nr:hypothetical protein [Bacteroidales bacterium]
MKKIILFVSLFFVIHISSAQQTWFIGGTACISYLDNFTFALEPQFGYEFSDKWAIGTGVGFTLVSDDFTYLIGIAEPFIRFCTWHNDRVFIDLKATAGFGFDKVLELCQIGITPSLRFRINEHWDMAADIGLFGAQYTYYGRWRPAFGINAASAGLWFAYRF